MGSKRVGLARTQKLIENLNRALAMGGSDITCETLTADTGVTATTGDVKASDGNVVIESAAKGIKTDIKTVTQATNNTTGVTINGHAGIITNAGQAVTANQNVEFTVTNSAAKATSLILLSVQDENTVNHMQLVAASHTHADGSFKITLANTGGSDTSATAIKIHFLIINAT